MLVNGDIIMALLPVGGILPAFNFTARILDKALFEVLKPAKKRMVTHECKTIWLIPQYLVSAYYQLVQHEIASNNINITVQ